MKKSYIGISRDHSGSMAYISDAAKQDYNDNIASIKKSAVREGIDTIVSVVAFCGGGVTNEVTLSSIGALRKLDYYPTRGGTPLYDSIRELIEQFETVPDKRGEDVSFLITAITDGEENESRRTSAAWLSQKIRQLQATDKWSFAFRVPRGYADALSRRLGVPRGNILEWEATEEGMRKASYETQLAYEGYTQLYASAASGTLFNTRSFYETNLNTVPKDQVRGKLNDVTSQVKLFDITAKDDKRQIRDYVEEKIGGHMPRGSAFYQLTKKENEVQQEKLLAVRDKKTKKVYSGTAARDLLGLPHQGTCSVVPGNHGDYDLFVQSTSVNRKLVGGTKLLFWNNVGQP